jgi:acyl-coenzyme A synthetase/AMP-(fatty) acid ligase
MIQSMQVSPLELENILLRHPKVLDAAVAGVPHDAAGEVPMAFIVRSPAAQAEDEEALRRELNSYMSEHLAEHKRLAGGIQFVEALAKSSSGKTQRKVLRDMAKAHALEKAESAVAVTATDAEQFDFDSDEDEDED